MRAVCFAPVPFRLSLTTIWWTEDNVVGYPLFKTKSHLSSKRKTPQRHGVPTSPSTRRQPSSTRRQPTRCAASASGPTMPRAAPTYATAACAPRLPAPRLPAPRLPARCLPRLHRLVACRIRTREACRPASATPPPPSLLACAKRCDTAPSRLLEPATLRHPVTLCDSAPMPSHPSHRGEPLSVLPRSRRLRPRPGRAQAQ